VFYAPLKTPDLRIDNALYLQLASPVADGQTVAVTNPDGQILVSLRRLHRRHEPAALQPGDPREPGGLRPEHFQKKAMVGYYLGDMGEMPISAATGFSVIDVTTNAVVFSGQPHARARTSATRPPAALPAGLRRGLQQRSRPPANTSSRSRAWASRCPSSINDGIAMGFARTYALGMYEQRSGTATTLPFTRFTHAADHTAPAQVPRTTPTRSSALHVDDDRRLRQHGEHQQPGAGRRRS
jgi:hypothetical protein